MADPGPALRRLNQPGGVPETTDGIPVLRTLDPGAPIAQSVVDAYAECLAHRWGLDATTGVLVEDSGISHHVARRDLGRPGDDAAAAAFRHRLRRRTAPYRLVLLPLVHRGHWTLCVLIVDPERRPWVPGHLLWADSADDRGFDGMPPGVPEYAAVVLGHRNVRFHNIRSPQQRPGDNNCAMHVMRNMEYLVGPPPGPDWDAPHRIDLHVALRPYAVEDVTHLRGSLHRILTHLLGAGADYRAVLRRYRRFLLLRGEQGE